MLFSGLNFFELEISTIYQKKKKTEKTYNSCWKLIRKRGCPSINKHFSEQQTMAFQSIEFTALSVTNWTINAA